MDLIDLVTRWGTPLVAIAVLLEQGGLPLPAAPLLVIAGALAEIGSLRPEHVFGAAILACVIADHAWYWVGRQYGRKVLATVCRLSLSPDTCVRQTDDLIGRHGAPLLLVAKFIPGVSAVAIPSAAASGLTYPRFLAFDILGSALWAGVYVGGGMIFSREVNRLLDSMSVIGGWGLTVFAVLIGIYVAMKVAHRLRLRRLHRLVRISPHEAAELIANDPDMLIVDARSILARRDDPRRLPRAIHLDERGIIEVLPLDAASRTIVTFCTCPNEASAALLAEQLIKAGFNRVRVLTGGPEALDRLGVAQGEGG